MYHQPEKRPAAVIAALIGWCIVAVLHCHVAVAYVYDVGDERGWNYDVVNWTNGKSFKTGDQLQFYYTIGEHNVVIVNQKIFEKCFDPNDKTKYQTFDSGSELIGLNKGYNYFASSLPRDCANGVKIAAYAN